MIISIVISVILQFFPIEDVKVTNAGIGGNTSEDLKARIEDDVISRKPDVVIIMVGTNDMVNSRKLVPYGAYKENVTAIVKRLEQEYIKVILVSPPPVDPTYLYTRHSAAAFENDPPNEKLDSVSDILKEISDRYKIGFVDAFEAFQKRGLPKHNQDDIIRNVHNSNKEDGVHLTPKGYTFLASLIFDYLLDNHYLKNDLEILCFGDSLTKGVHVEGSGTSSGETYPAALLRFIKDFRRSSGYVD